MRGVFFDIFDYLLATSLYSINEGRKEVEEKQKRGYQIRKRRKEILLNILLKLTLAMGWGGEISQLNNMFEIFVIAFFIIIF